MADTGRGRRTRRRSPGRQVRPDRRFGASEHDVAQRPVGIRLQERVDLCEAGAAVLVEQIAPLDQPARDRIVSLLGQGTGARPVAAVAGLEGAGIEVVIGRAQHVDRAGAMFAVCRRVRFLGICDRLHHDHGAGPLEPRGQIIRLCRGAKCACRDRADKNADACCSHSCSTLMVAGGPRAP